MKGGVILKGISIWCCFTCALDFSIIEMRLMVFPPACGGFKFGPVWLLGNEVMESKNEKGGIEVTSFRLARAVLT
jgi:hypothetical protein